MAWKLVNPNITNDPSYLDPRLSDDESKISSNTTSLAEIATQITPSMTTVQIQNILNTNSKVLFLDGTFNVNPLFIPSNIVIYMSPNTLIKANTGYTSRQSVLCLHASQNVVIYGNNATIQMIKSEYTTGEWRHCVEIWQSKNVKIYNLTCIDSGGDGFYIGTNDYDQTGTNENILIHNCHASNNRRQGMSISNVRNLIVDGGLYENSNGTAPQYGIDIEPSYGFEYIENIQIINVKTQNNVGGGIQIALGYCQTQASILVDGFYSYNEGQDFLGALTIAGGSGNNNSRTGNITIRNVNIVNALYSGIWIQSQRTNIEPIFLENVNIINPANQGSVNSARANGVHIETISTDTYTTYGNITMRNITVNDTRGTKLLYSPIAIYGKTGTTMQNITIENLQANGWTDGVANPVLYSGSNFLGLRIVNFERLTYTEFSNDTLTRYNGMKVMSGSAITLTLPDATVYQQFEVVIQNTSPTNSLIVACSGTNKINLGSQKTQITGSGIGAYIILKSDTSGNWYATTVVGTWA